MAKKYTLYLLRHAKTKKAADFDYDRLLHKRGIRQAQELGSHLKNQNISVNRIISSEAPRAVETGRIILSTLGMEADQLETDRRLYGTTPGKWMERLHATPETTHSVMIIGHNPELEILSRRLLGFPLVILPPCGLITVEFTSPWKSLAAGKGTLAWSHYPEGYDSVRPETSEIASNMAQAVRRSLPARLRRREVVQEIKPVIDAAMSELAANINRISNGHK